MRSLARRALILAALVLAAAPACAQPVLKVKVFADGVIEADGRRTTVQALDGTLRAHAARSGAVWYYREDPRAEPHPNANLVIQAIIRYKLPVSLSTKPDFSDYVDENGVPRPRK